MYILYLCAGRGLAEEHRYKRPANMQPHIYGDCRYYRCIMAAVHVTSVIHDGSLLPDSSLMLNA